MLVPYSAEKGETIALYANATDTDDDGYASPATTVEVTDSVMSSTITLTLDDCCFTPQI